MKHRVVEVDTVNILFFVLGQLEQIAVEGRLAIAAFYQSDLEFGKHSFFRRFHVGVLDILDHGEDFVGARHRLRHLDCGERGGIRVDEQEEGD